MPIPYALDVNGNQVTGNPRSLEDFEVLKSIGLLRCPHPLCGDPLIVARTNRTSNTTSKWCFKHHFKGERHKLVKCPHYIEQQTVDWNSRQFWEQQLKVIQSNTLSLAWLERGVTSLSADLRMNERIHRLPPSAVPEYLLESALHLLQKYSTEENEVDSLHLLRMRLLAVSFLHSEALPLLIKMLAMTVLLGADQQRNKEFRRLCFTLIRGHYGVIEEADRKDADKLEQTRKVLSDGVLFLLDSLLQLFPFLKALDTKENNLGRDARFICMSRPLGSNREVCISVQDESSRKCIRGRLGATNSPNILDAAVSLNPEQDTLLIFRALSLKAGKLSMLNKTKKPIYLVKLKHDFTDAQLIKLFFEVSQKVMQKSFGDQTGR